MLCHSLQPVTPHTCCHVLGGWRMPASSHTCSTLQHHSLPPPLTHCNMQITPTHTPAALLLHMHMHSCCTCSPAALPPAEGLPCLAYIRCTSHAIQQLFQRMMGANSTLLADTLLHLCHLHAPEKVMDDVIKVTVGCSDACKMGSGGMHCTGPAQASGHCHAPGQGWSITAHTRAQKGTQKCNSNKL
jgi:hypothetical protein